MTAVRADRRGGGPSHAGEHDREPPAVRGRPLEAAAQERHYFFLDRFQDALDPDRPVLLDPSEPVLPGHLKLPEAGCQPIERMCQRILPADGSCEFGQRALHVAFRVAGSQPSG